MAYIHWFEGDFERAIADAEAAVALAPYYAGQLSFLARLQIAAGNTDRGLEWVQESVRLDPTLPRNTRVLAWAYYISGEYEKSLEAAKTHAELSRKYSSEAYWFMAASYSALRPHSRSASCGQNDAGNGLLVDADRRARSRYQLSI